MELEINVKLKLFLLHFAVQPAFLLIPFADDILQPNFKIDL